MCCLENFYDLVMPGGVILLDNYTATHGDTKSSDKFFADKKNNYKNFLCIKTYIIGRIDLKGTLAFMSRKTYFLPSEIKEFKEKGFVIVRNLFSELEMREVKKNANELLNEEPEFGKQMVYLEENLLNPGKKQVSRNINSSL